MPLFGCLLGIGIGLGQKILQQVAYCGLRVSMLQKDVTYYYIICTKDVKLYQDISRHHSFVIPHRSLELATGH